MRSFLWGCLQLGIFAAIFMALRPVTHELVQEGKIAEFSLAPAFISGCGAFFVTWLLSKIFDLVGAIRARRLSLNKRSG